MKRFISSILIPCLLLQLYGCFSYRDLTLDELQNYYGSNSVRIKTNQDEAVINRKYTSEYSMDWRTGDSSIIIKVKEINLENDTAMIVNNNYEIKFHQIDTIEVEEFDNIKTVGLTLGIISVMAAFIIVAAGSMDIMDMSGGW
jgi:hypothetical protein